MKYAKWSACGGFLAVMLFFVPAFAQEDDKSDKVDCSHLTAEQMGDKDACWNVKKAESGHTRSATQAYVEIVHSDAGGSIVNVAQPALSSDTQNNIYEVPFFKSAVPSALSPSGNSGEGRPGTN